MPKAAITLRNLPAKVERALLNRAKRRRTSANKAVIEMLEEALGLGPQDAKPHLYHDLDDLAGRWCAEEAALFESALHDQRRIDPEDWR